MNMTRTMWIKDDYLLCIKQQMVKLINKGWKNHVAFVYAQKTG